MFSLLKKTVSSLSGTRNKISHILAGLTDKSFLSESDIEQLEEVLLNADIGWELTDSIINVLREPDKKGTGIEKRLYNCIWEYLRHVDQPKDLAKVIVLVGINGTGKTTSAAKLGGYFVEKNKSVSLVAADTFRAAAIEQIRVWSNKLNIHLISNNKSEDPSSVAYDGVSSGIKRDDDHIIVDTSGRVYTNINLMQELQKIYRTVNKLTNSVDVLITIDANTGQNGILQVREFFKIIPLSGVILTKMDGTARGGIAVQIMQELKLPIYYIGVGEKTDDLIPFDLASYIKGLTAIEIEMENG